MAKTIFEEIGGTYAQQGDYFLPNLSFSEEEQKTIGIWGQRRRQFLKENHRVLYMNLLTSGKLNSHLAGINEQAEEMFSRRVKQFAEKEDVTEKLKAENQIEWVGKMNSIRNRAVEIVNTELIFAL